MEYCVLFNIHLTVFPQDGIDSPIIGDIGFSEKKPDFVFARLARLQLVLRGQPHQAVDRHSTLLRLDTRLARILWDK